MPSYLKQPISRTIPSKALAAAFMLAFGLSMHASAQTWTPLTGGGKQKSVDITQSTVFTIPPSIQVKGGTLRAILVGAGEGGSSAKGLCEEMAVQGGKGGDGGEVVEYDIPLAPGQCGGALTIAIGERGRGALRSGNAASVGESGGGTTISCNGTPIAAALGGGRRTDAYTAARASRGGVGGVIMNTSEVSKDETFDQRNLTITPATDGQTGRNGYGSGGGGGGVTYLTNGVSARIDGVVARRSVLRHAPMGKGGYGAGSGAGAAGYASDSSLYPAENGIQYGAGGGGGHLACNSTTALTRDAGNGASGLVRFSWSE